MFVKISPDSPERANDLLDGLTRSDRIIWIADAKPSLETDCSETYFGTGASTAMMNTIPSDNMDILSSESNSKPRRREDKLQRLHQKGIAVTPSDLDALQAYSRRIQHHLRVLQATSQVAE